MKQYQVKYISKNDRIAVAYLHAVNKEEAKSCADSLPECKQVISLRVWPENPIGQPSEGL